MGHLHLTILCDSFKKNAITCHYKLKLKKCHSSPQKKTWNLVYLATIPPNPIVVQSLSPFLPMMFSWPSTQPKHPSKTSTIPAQAHCKWSRRSWYSRCKSLPSHCGLRAVALVKCIGIPIYPHPLANWWFQPSEKYESQLGWLFPIYGKIKNVPNHIDGWNLHMLRWSFCLKPIHWQFLITTSQRRAWFHKNRTPFPAGKRITVKSQLWNRLFTMEI